LALEAAAKFDACINAQLKPNRARAPKLTQLPKQFLNPLEEAASQQ
jgi:hypothetical protein